MNKYLFIIGLGGLLLLPTPHLNSQSKEEPRISVESLQALKRSNRELIEKQQKTLQKLDELSKTSEQIKILGKRG